MSEEVTAQSNESEKKDDSFDRLRRRIFWMMPSGIYVVGSRDGERRNLMNLNWATQASMKPVRLAIGVKKTAFTHELIAASGYFTLNFLSRNDRALARKFVKPTPWEPTESTLNGFKVSEAPSGTPVLDQAVAWLDCKVWHAVDSGDHSLFIGDVNDIHLNSENDENSPEVLRMEDTRMNYGG